MTRRQRTSQKAIMAAATAFAATLSARPGDLSEQALVLATANALAAGIVTWFTPYYRLTRATPTPAEPDPLPTAGGGPSQP